jgi:hypothetical protein
MNDFSSTVENVFVEEMKKHGITKCTVQNATGDKAIISRDKHGFYKIKYTYEKDHK